MLLTVGEMGATQNSKTNQPVVSLQTNFSLMTSHSEGKNLIYLLFKSVTEIAFLLPSHLVNRPIGNDQSSHKTVMSVNTSSQLSFQYFDIVEQRKRFRGGESTILIN